MKRGQNYNDNITKLYTFVNMKKSLNYLKIYIEKITNKRCQSLKFIEDFEPNVLDLLFTSLKMLNFNNKITFKDISKIDKKELDFYIEKSHGLKYFSKQNSTIKNEEQLINFIKDSLITGDYIYNMNNTVRFSNNIVVDSDWLVSFSNFLINSFNINQNISSDGKKYTFRAIDLPLEESFTNVRNYLKNIKIYDYSVTRKDEKSLSYNDSLYLYNLLHTIEDYDFSKLKDLNSLLSKEHFILSVSKENINITHDNKKTLENIVNENGEKIDARAIAYVKDCLNITSRPSEKNKQELIDICEILRSLAHAYKKSYSLNECRKLFTLDGKEEFIDFVLLIADFYIAYIYDETEMNENFPYEDLNLEELRPTVVDYETSEYKNILSRLSNLNKKVIAENRKINKYLECGKLIPKTNEKQIKENSQNLAAACGELEKIVAKVDKLREELQEIKEFNHTKNNINKTKLKYIKEAIASGCYSFDDTTITFEKHNKNGSLYTFNLNIEKNTLYDILFSESNINVRLSYYQL